ncbi:MAG: barstar family protein [Ardenticatenales bacterium]|nr:barstar family protein [Ardenticatenales bacterium]
MNLHSQNDDIVSAIVDLQSSPVKEVDDWVLKQPQIETVLKGLHYNVMRISQSPRNKRELLEALKQACGFPDYFGFNWSALKDCLIDFHWREAKGYILLFEKPLELDSSNMNMFLDIVREVGAIWKSEDILFKVLLTNKSSSCQTSD